MSLAWRYSDQALADLKELDQVMRVRITNKVSMYCQAPNPFVFAKSLEGALKGLYRFRVGDYRVIFEKDITGKFMMLLILRVKNRNEAY